MAMKKPIVSTRLPGMVEEFGHDCGMVYVDRPEDVALKAVELAAQGDLADLGAKAFKFVQDSSWDNMVNEFERIAQHAITRRRSHSS